MLRGGGKVYRGDEVSGGGGGVLGVWGGGECIYSRCGIYIIGG